ncbi:Hypothetical protein F387_01453 [Wohlfahrtiimonas chitiniclastica SH04]|uniref:EpsG family protein n=1 Tax=Wohlfahrtiimonas chitiniclastica SH04 TaxID=1261130 RepID=L8XXW4_9GAMM|nr:EpsG family protein [Wohlfahrtiimonas chitiniclastica]ELV07649.1 Hypothetical protein F387_01453 [Wohlfahrtiimonas chitiniclastica SH04]
MYIYLLGYLLLFLGSVLYFRTYPKIKLVYGIGLIYIFTLSVFRGDVGTDTGTYESIIDMINWNTWYQQATEVGFNFSIALLKISNWSNTIILRVLTAFYSFLLIIIISLSKDNIRQVIMIYFLPVTIYIFSMNALRFGIAANLLMLAFLFYKKNKLISFVALNLAISFHITVFILIPLVVFFANISYKSILWIVILAIISCGVFYIFHGHIYNKISLYSNYVSPSVYSGLSDILVFFILVYFCLTYPVSQKYRIVFTLIMSILVTLSFILTKFSYAGLRLLQLLVIFMPCIFIYLANIRYNVRSMPKYSFWILLFSSFVTAIFTLRNFLNSEGSPYAFIPYVFIFN